MFNMSMLQSIQSYAMHFNDPREIDHLLTYKADWFLDGTSFNDNVWIVKNKRKKLKLNFSYVIAPGQKLIDPEHSGMLRTAKIVTYLVRTSCHHSKGRNSATSQQAMLYRISTFFRWLLSNNIHHLSSVNADLFKLYLFSTTVPFTKTFDTVAKLEALLKPLTRKELLAKYTVIGKNQSQPNLITGKMLFDVGMSARTVSQCKVVAAYMVEIRHRYCLRLMPTMKERYLNKSFTYQDQMSYTRIAEELTFIEIFIRLNTNLPDLFEPHFRLQSNFFSALNITPHSYATLHGKAKGRTKSMPIKVFMQLMDASIRWIVDYGDELIALKELANEENEKLKDKFPSKADKRRRLFQWLMEYKPQNEGPCAPWPIIGYQANIRQPSLTPKQMAEIKRKCDSGAELSHLADEYGICKTTITRYLKQYKLKPTMTGLSLNKALYGVLPASAIMVIYAFTARREVEVEGLEAGCCVPGPNGPVLTSYIAKTYQDYKKLPTARIVKVAIELLEKLSAPVRSGDQQSIFTFPNVKDDNPSQFRLKEVIADLWEVFELPTNENGDRWELSEHQFRRMFALMYYYRYDGGELSTLSWYLQHTDWEMTLAYITDEYGNSELDDAMHERIFDYMDELTNPSPRTSDNKYSGYMAHELAEFTSKLEFEDAKRFDRREKVKSAIADVGLAFTFISEGACFGKSPSLKTKANCYRDGRIQTATACSNQCKGCPALLGFETGQSELNFNSILNPSESPMLNAVMEKS
jgi:hypothetical protein